MVRIFVVEICNGEFFFQANKFQHIDWLKFC